MIFYTLVTIIKKLITRDVMIIMIQVGHFQRLLLLTPATGHIHTTGIWYYSTYAPISLLLFYLFVNRELMILNHNNNCYATLLELSHVFSIDNIDWYDI